MKNKIYVKNKIFSGLVGWARQTKTENKNGITLDGVTCTNVEDELDALESNLVSLEGNFATVEQTIASSGSTTISYPSGFEYSNIFFLGARCYTKYGSWVDYTYDSSAYFGNLTYTSASITYTPKTAGNSTKISFMFGKS